MRTMSSLFPLIVLKWRFQAILLRSRWRSAGWRRCLFIRWEGISGARSYRLLNFYWLWFNFNFYFLLLPSPRDTEVPSFVTICCYCCFQTCCFVLVCGKICCSFPSPTLRMFCKTACRTLTWNWTHLNLMAETPSWIPARAPVTPAAPKVPCAPCHEQMKLVIHCY